MPNAFVIFPAGKEAAAAAYKAYGDVKYQALSGEVGGQLGLLNTDAHGQKVCVYFGPPYIYDLNVGPVAEPADGPAMRADGVLAENWDRPQEE